jgi:predicted nicotinamide N-methyase
MAVDHVFARPRRKFLLMPIDGLTKTVPQQGAARAHALTAFVQAETALATAPLVPEIQLHLALRARSIFVAADDFMDGWVGSRPYWAFAWPGGQGLARYLLDRPELVAGKRVLDIGSGSGIGAIAALKAGAASALAADIDPLADAAAKLNAIANGVPLETTTDDLLGALPDCDLLLIGDLVYEPDLQIRVAALLDDAVARGVPVLYGDRTSARRPRQDFVLLQDYEAPLTPALVDDFIERARVWRLSK